MSHSPPLGRMELALIAIAGFAVCLPLLSVTYPAIHDYPFHLARLFIMNRLGEGTFLDKFYEFGTFLLPNVAQDAIAWPLSWWFGEVAAMKTFVVMSLLSLLLGTVLLHFCVWRRASVWPVIGVFFLYNGIFAFGFFNFLFGSGLALAAAALWIFQTNSSARLRFVCATGCALLIMLCHMSAFGIYAIIVSSYELFLALAPQRYRNTPAGSFSRRLTRLLLSALPFVIAIVAFVLLSPTSDEVNAHIPYPPWMTNKFLQAGSTLITGIVWLDVVSYAILVALLGLLLLKRALRFSGPLVLATSVVALAFLLAPASMLDSHFVDVRLLPIGALIAVSATDLRIIEPSAQGIGNASSRSLLMLTAIVVVVIAVGRGSALAVAWRDYEPTIAELVDGLGKIETNATLFTLTARPNPGLRLYSDENRARWKPPIKHVDSYAHLHRPVFVVTTFADPTKQPINYKSAFAPLKAVQTDSPLHVPDIKSLQDFVARVERGSRNDEWPVLGATYLLILDHKRLPAQPLFPQAERIAEGARFLLLSLPRLDPRG